MRTLLAILSVAALVSLGSLAGGPTSAVAQTAPGGVNHVHSILIEPNNPRMLYVGTHYQLYRSTDGGRHWHGVLRQMALSLALDPAHPSTIYAVTLQGGLLRSTDGGAHWRAPASTPPKGRVTGVQYDPSSRAILAYGNGLYRSTDGGKRWTRSLTGQSVANLAVGSGGTVYAATGNGLDLSRDGGAHWKSVPPVGNQPVIQVAASGKYAYVAAAISTLMTSNGGKTWKTLGSAPQGIEFLTAAPSSPTEVLAEVATQGFYASWDAGKSWHQANKGIHDKNFNASTVRVAPSNPRIAYTGSWGVHFYASLDGGRHWSLIATLKH